MFHKELLRILLSLFLGCFIRNVNYTYFQDLSEMVNFLGGMKMRTQEHIERTINEFITNNRDFILKARGTLTLKELNNLFNLPGGTSMPGLMTVVGLPRQLILLGVKEEESKVIEDINKLLQEKVNAFKQENTPQASASQQSVAPKSTATTSTVNASPEAEATRIVSEAKLIMNDLHPTFKTTTERMEGLSALLKEAENSSILRPKKSIFSRGHTESYENAISTIQVATIDILEKDREKQTLTADDVKKATQILNTHKSAVKMGTPEYANHVALKAQQARFSDVSFKK